MTQYDSCLCLSEGSHRLVFAVIVGTESAEGVWERQRQQEGGKPFHPYNL